MLNSGYDEDVESVSGMKLTEAFLTFTLEAPYVVSAKSGGKERAMCVFRPSSRRSEMTVVLS